MRPLTLREQEIAESLALAVADAFCTRIPTLFGEPPEVVVAVTLPIANSLVRAEARAAKNKKHARKYRRMQREVRRLVKSEPETAVGLPDLGATIPFNAEH
jgi:hypothetical protein